MFRLALCGKNYELLEKIESHIQSFVETYKNETKAIPHRKVGAILPEVI